MPYDFSSIDTNAIPEDAGFLVDILNQLKSGKLKMGMPGQMAYGNLAKAMTYKGPYSDNTIRNNMLGIQNAGASEMFRTKEGMTDQAAATGAIDTGGFGKGLAEAGADIQSRVNQNALSTYDRMAKENEQAKLDRVNSAQEGLATWMNLRRKRRMNQAQFYV